MQRQKIVKDKSDILLKDKCLNKWLQEHSKAAKLFRMTDLFTQENARKLISNLFACTLEGTGKF